MRAAIPGGNAAAAARAAAWRSPAARLAGEGRARGGASEPQGAGATPHAPGRRAV